MTVREKKRRRLEAKGWKFGTAQEFLRLSDEEAACIDLKARLATGLRKRRRHRSLTQADLAKRAQSSQSRMHDSIDPQFKQDFRRVCHVLGVPKDCGTRRRIFNQDGSAGEVELVASGLRLRERLKSVPAIPQQVVPLR